MVRRRLYFGAAALLALIGARPAAAGAINFTTGDVEKDMPASAAGVLTIINHPLNAKDPNSPADPNYYQQVQAPWMNDAGRINGWAIKDLRLNYDQASDRLYVGVNFYGVGGDAYGNRAAGGPDPGRGYTAGLPAHLGFGSTTDQTITVGLDLTNSGKPTFVAGIPSNHLDSRLIGPGTDGFTLNWYQSGGGLGASYDASRPSLNSFSGNLAFEPSKEHPDFEFSIANLSKIPGFDLNKGVGVTAFAGTSADVDVGEDSVAYTHVSFEIPEPATLFAWAAVASAAGWRGLARRRRPVGSASMA